MKMVKCKGRDMVSGCKHKGMRDESQHRWCDACEAERLEEIKNYVPVRLTDEQYKEAAYWHFFE